MPLGLSRYAFLWCLSCAFFTMGYVRGPPRAISPRSQGELLATLVTTLSPPPLAQLPKSMDPKLVLLNRLLIDVWEKIAFPSEADEDTYFRLKDYSLTRQDVPPFIKHFQVCRDCAADGAYLLAGQDDKGDDALQLTKVSFPMAVEDDSDDDWGNWDDDTKKMISEDMSEQYVPPFPTETSDDLVLADTKEWVRKVIADFNVCPFTVDPLKAGIPMGGVRYTVSRARSADEAFLRFWQEVYALFASSEKDMSTILLIFPEIDLFGNFELFEEYCAALNDGLCGSSMCMESEIQLVFFHPKYAFRDGQARTTSEAGAANFARRGPWPMINILRTPQVRLAQKGIPTGIVYKQNEERLSAVGANVLEKMLFDRNWESLPVHSTSAAARNLREKALERQQEEAEMDQKVSAADASSVAAQCPFPHAAAAAAASSATVAATTAAAPSKAAAVAPAKAAGEQDRLESLVSTSTTGQSEEDLLRLADEIDRWMAGL